MTPSFPLSKPSWKQFTERYAEEAYPGTMRTSIASWTKSGPSPHQLRRGQWVIDTLRKTLGPSKESDREFYDRLSATETRPREEMWQVISPLLIKRYNAEDRREAFVAAFQKLPLDCGQSDKKLAKRLAKAFVEIPLHKQYQSILEEIGIKPTPDTVSWEALPKILKQDRKAISAPPDSLKPHSARTAYYQLTSKVTGFSPLMTTNHCNAIYTENYEDFSTQVLAVPTPTVDNCLSTEPLNLFRFWLDGLSRPYLYFNHQKAETSLFNDESSRCKALAKLDKDHKFFFLFNLPMDLQIENGRLREDFKKWLQKALVEGTDGFYIPAEKIQAQNKDYDHSKTIKKILLELAWQDKESLSSVEQLNLLFQLYTRIGQEYTQILRPYASGDSCKDTIDRSAVMATYKLVDSYLRMGKELTAQMADHIRITLVARAWLVKGQNVLKSRFTPFLKALSVLIESPPPKSTILKSIDISKSSMT